MSKLTLLRNVFRATALTPNPLPRVPWRSLSTEGESLDPSDDPFLQTSTEGLVFGRLTGIGKNTMKTDVLHYLEGCNLSTDDIKFDYTKAYNPVGVLLQFPSESSFDTAVKQTIRRGRLYKIEKIDRSEWDLKTSYDGKVVLLQGIPRNAVQEDVERFLSGSNFELSTFQMLFRQGFPDPVRIALVHFPTRLDAMNAFCFNNRGFCLNSPVSMRVLH
ncbi:uncharacterized protein LOC109727564 isoform X2 [Ananas comosus]|uniref:Uncharacterized protein LOC109727564 isoform X2 n=1 Tax=Ananas comosus TaxID=4615 RepID=A0A6P5GZN9_ANACO|nr:uncharacterized protein LOC109727564 isoform X2 [Ananas comosus]